MIMSLLDDVLTVLFVISGKWKRRCLLHAFVPSFVRLQSFTRPCMVCCHLHKFRFASVLHYSYFPPPHAGSGGCKNRPAPFPDRMSY